MYELTIAIHRGTITSRDVEQPQEFHTMEECIAALNAAKKLYSNIGYVIWFANVKLPDGSQRTLESNLNYNR
mgnify:CR=1 FL=1